MNFFEKYNIWLINYNLNLYIKNKILIGKSCLGLIIRNKRCIIFCFYIKYGEYVIEVEICDDNEDDFIDVYNVFLFIIIVCFEVY